MFVSQKVNKQTEIKGMAMTIEAFIDALKEKGITLSPEQIQQFHRYWELLVEWNEKVNLTAITDQEDVYLKHFYDSLMPLWANDLLQGEVSLCDVGAGAGFPSIPLKIVQPDLEVTIVDSLNKRITFLNLLVEELGLTGVQNVHGRAEELGQDPVYRGQFDRVTARAVASLNVLCEFCLPLVKKGGYFIAMKGQKADEEVAEAEKAIQVLGAKLEASYTEDLPQDEGERTILTIRKTLDTPKKYPRRPGIPAKKPLK